MLGGDGTSAARSGGLEIVQVVRRLHPHGGVGGVAHALDAAFRAQGVVTGAITLDSLSSADRKTGPVRRWERALEVVAFTLLAAPALRRVQGRGAVVLVHGDVLGGDIYVDHGLHKGLVARRPWLLLNPLHIFIWAREEVRHAFGAYRRLVCLSAAGEAALRRAYPLSRRAKVTRLPNGVDLSRFHPEPSRLSRPLDPADVRLVFIGHEFGRKGLRHVLDALPRLPPGVRLTVVGAGDLAWAQRRAEALGVAARVDILGGRSDVADILRRSDLLVLPSAYEAWPLVALEAMATGVPVLLGDFPAAEEIVGDGEGGRVAACSGAAIAAAIGDMMEDDAGFLRLRQGALERARRFSWPQVAAGYVALAQEVRRARGAPRP